MLVLLLLLATTAVVLYQVYDTRQRAARRVILCTLLRGERTALDFSGFHMIVSSILRDLERDGLVAVRTEEGSAERGGLPRYVYRLTAAGTRVALRVSVDGDTAAE